MDDIIALIGKISGFVWGPFLLLPLLLGTGAYLMIVLRFMPILNLGMALRHMIKGRHHAEGAKGELSPFNALMTSMAATVGTGNIVGVATAIQIGGPGAIFWMWCTALVGMATKYCEATLAVKYRDVTHDGSYVGGPMYYIRKGMGENWKWLATLFAIFGSIACFGIGNLTQANSIAENLNGAAGVNPYVTAAVLFLLVGIVLVGGVKRIGAVAGKMVPIMALLYIAMGIIAMIYNYERVPEAFGLIFSHAFTPISATGGFAGAALKTAIQSGVSRGMFSNEAGLGSAPIAHATAITNSPVRQGFLGMLDPFIDTIIICTITALIILVSGEWTTGGSAARLTAVSFGTALPGQAGQYCVAIGLILFAFSTILGWSLYGERCVIYLFGTKARMPFRIVFTFVVPLGALSRLELAWGLSDLFNGLMALPNLIALLVLSPVVVKLTREYFDERKARLEAEKNMN